MDQLTQKFECLAVLLASAFALTACGGSDVSSQSADSTATVASTGVKQVEQVQRVATAVQHEVPVPVSDGSGTVLTYSSTGFIDNTNLFFTPLGNGRSCSTCHQEGQAWSVTPAALLTRFNASNGTDPIFQLVDGANSPLAIVTTLAQKQVAYSMLLTKGLIRIGLPIPGGAEFELTQVNDPYGFASAAELSLFRRPLPTTNLKFESTVMWDGRETLGGIDSTLCVANVTPAECFATTNFDLLDQANSAAKSHAQLTVGLTAAQQQAVVGFESALYTAQASDNLAGSLSVAGALGGPQNLSNDPFYFGINDFFAGDYLTKAPFTRNVMNLFSAWTTAAPPPPPPPPPGARGAPPPAGNNAVANAQASIARGEQIFNTRPFNISGVNGLNDVLNQPNLRGSCSICHSAPSAGTQSVPRLLNTGVTTALLRTPDLPLYTLKNIATGLTVQTTDPGRALVTGKWADVGKIKVPNLRALAARAPYFHNGSQANLTDVVHFYDRRFQIGFTPQEVTDLANFLQAL
ncbi:MAG TPA: cytochrome C [Burkholderiaceae bacterium]|nr:cytochrome C [Burkholderiaceae bacterium]